MGPSTDRVVQNEMLRLLIGTSPDPVDLLAYAIGAAVCLPLGVLLDWTSNRVRPIGIEASRWNGPGAGTWTASL